MDSLCCMLVSKMIWMSVCGFLGVGFWERSLLAHSFDLYEARLVDMYIGFFLRCWKGR